MSATSVNRTSLPLRPAYAGQFRCIGSACEDTCCAGWTVPIDRAAWEKYQNLPPSPFTILMYESMAPTPEDAEPSTGANPAVFAKIRMNAENHCPLLSENHLCRIQSELGDGFLSHACATYPRIVASIDGEVETSLDLSCPEAARLVLLNRDLLGPTLTAPDPSPQRLAENVAAAGLDAAPDKSSLRQWFLPIRGVVLGVVRNRAYPLWQRLFMLGVFLRRLESIADREFETSIPGYLADFKASVASGKLRPAMQTLPVDSKAQLDVVLRLAGMMLHKSNVRPRFVECIQSFTTGIGNGPGATLDILAAQYARAHDRHFAPFFKRHPHILENYLVNTILRLQFPFGKEGMRPGAQPRMSRQFAMLTAQFALMRGLLIGVAGHHGSAFSTAHVVHTAQAASKHFEHHPEFLDMAYTLLVESRMDEAQGLAILLRNAETDRAADEARPTSPAIYAPGRQGGRSAWAPDRANSVRPD